MTTFTQPTTPGELLTLGPIDPVENPHNIFKTMRDTCPVGEYDSSYYIASFEWD